MEFQDNNYANLQQFMLQKYPGLMKRVMLFDSSISKRGCSVRIGDGDRYSDFDIYIIGNGPDSSSLSEQLSNLIKSTCYQCGATIHERIVAKYDYNNNLCDHCYSSSMPGLDKIRSLATLNYVSLKRNESFSYPKIKVRLQNSDGNFFFEHLPNIYFSEGEFYVSNAIANMERVKYAGMYLGTRDRNGERLYEGDIVLCRHRDNGRRFWGLAIEYFIGEEKKLIVCHGGDSFPSFLTWADEFEIMANFFAVSNDRFSSSRDFTGWGYDWHPFEDLCENRTKELGWKMG